MSTVKFTKIINRMDWFCAIISAAVTVWLFVAGDTSYALLSAAATIIQVAIAYFRPLNKVAGLMHKRLFYKRKTTH